MVHQPPQAGDTLDTEPLCSDLLLHSTPISKSARSDVHFPLSTPRRIRAPSMSSTTETTYHDERDTEKLTVRVKGVPDEPEAMHIDDTDGETVMTDSWCQQTTSSLSIEDLPLEVQGVVLDHIFGDIHSLIGGSTTLQPGSKNITSSMRHPRRRAVADLALVSPAWRELVQERIYRHIKIKGTRAGLRESQEWFSENHHLTKLIRHIEFWVPVWGDKASMDTRTFDTTVPTPTGNRDFHQLASTANSNLMTANEVLGFNFKLSVYSATLSEIFQHIAIFFPEARVFTLEGGHCKKSNMIRHFPQLLFNDPNQSLTLLPNITTFAMRGAWNVMRDPNHWRTIQAALPNITEWHCAYAKPRLEAYSTISAILLDHFSPQLRHVNISLDGFYSKESPSSPSGFAGFSEPVHLCQRLGRIAPFLESLSYTGKICECFWTAAAEALRKTKKAPRLRALEIVVKKCCRPPVMLQDPETGETVTAILVDDVMAEGASITNLTFIRAFERLVVSTVKHLDSFSLLEYIRIRFIDLDSPCALLNPYFQLLNEKCYGLWNEEILDLLAAVRPGLAYEELGEGIGASWRKDDGGVNVIGGMLYPRSKPKAIKSSSYRILADARG